ncbi:MAG: ABC transporter permease [Methylophilus methylotrophus]|uniref:ABC transporter permease n=1 Tax=Methylophilus methylotrophus TaxID=17 RepID=A0A5C7WIJ5_METME|nr:ABC transporter permease [Methylophilus sp.]PPD13244.1 MAG: ABC transporter permease [Methylophilus sp.]TXI37150.1 MAG: ABC transporter permease [Methylophilus methylotrophus]
MKLFSLLTLGFWLLVVIMGHAVGLNPNQIDLNAILQWPSSQHWLGTDDLGRDILARVIRGVEVSFLVTVVVTAVTMSIGLSIGLVAGYKGGKLDAALMQLTNIFLAFPGMLLAIAFAAVLGAGINNLILALCLTGWVTYARLTRGQSLALRQRLHVLAAESLGASSLRVMRLHILPLLVSILLVEAAYSMASVMIAEASLSFLGLGIQAPNASWGAMLRDAVRFMLVAPHYVLTVGVCMMSLILAINLGGDVLRDKLDVRSERQA